MIEKSKWWEVALEAVILVVITVGSVLLFILGYRGSRRGLDEAGVDLSNAQDGQRKAVESADRIGNELGRVAESVDRNKAAVESSLAGVDRATESLDLGTRGIDDAQTIVERDSKLLEEAESIFRRNKK